MDTNGARDSVVVDGGVTDDQVGDTPVSSDGGKNEVPPSLATKDSGSMAGQSSPGAEDIKYIYLNKHYGE